jgi:GxxExxY protein
LVVKKQNHPDHTGLGEHCVTLTREVDQRRGFSRQDKEEGREPIPAEVDFVAAQVVNAAFQVHSRLGPGLLESVYEVCSVHELTKAGLRVERQVVLPVIYDGIRLDAGLRIDAVVEGCILIELKAVETILPVHRAQLLTYLKLSGHRLGLVINFNVPVIKHGIVRMVL